MPIKLGNNARAHLAAPLAADGTTIVLSVEESATFPSLSAGEWFPLTICDADGNLEVAKVTARSGNLLTATRAQEATSARDWLAGDRAEIRFTAGVVEAIRQESADAVAAASTQASTALSTAITNLANQTATNLAAAILANEPIGSVKDWALTFEPAGWMYADGRVLTTASGSSVQALRTALINASYPYGQDGSGNPKLPDARGRATVGPDNMGSGAAGRLTGGVLGAGLGAQTHTLTAAEMPTHNHAVTDPGHNHTVNDPTHAHSVYDPGHSHTASQDNHTHDANYGRKSKLSSAEVAGYGLAASGAFLNRALIDNGAEANTSGATANGVYVGAAVTSIGIYGAGTGIYLSASGTGISTQNNGSGAAHNNVQPSLVLNKIIKYA